MGSSDSYEEKAVWFRLIVEMENGQLHAMTLSKEQDEALQDALANIVGDNLLNVHAIPFATSDMLTPESH